MNQPDVPERGAREPDSPASSRSPEIRTSPIVAFSSPPQAQAAVPPPTTTRPRSTKPLPEPASSSRAAAAGTRAPVRGARAGTVRPVPDHLSPERISGPDPSRDDAVVEPVVVETAPVEPEPVEPAPVESAPAEAAQPAVATQAPTAPPPSARKSAPSAARSTAAKPAAKKAPTDAARNKTAKPPTTKTTTSQAAGATAAQPRTRTKRAPAAGTKAAAAPTAPPSPKAAAPARHPAPVPPPDDAPAVLVLTGLVKRFGPTVAVNGIDLTVRAGSFTGIVGPNGAGKTTTLSMVSGLLRPDAGTVRVHGIDVWRQPERAKRAIGVLPDTLRLFDRLTGAQLLTYAGLLRGLDGSVVRRRARDLITALGLGDAAGRLVADYSAGMTKKIALAAAMIHAPRVLVLDEPFESLDPVSSGTIVEILQDYVRSGGTVVLSSHGMDLIERVCDSVAVVVGGKVLAAGPTDDVRGGRSLEERFVELAGGARAAEGLEWLHSFSD